MCHAVPIPVGGETRLRRNFGQQVVAFTASDEESVVAGAITSDEPVSARTEELDESAQSGATVVVPVAIIDGMVVNAEVGPVGHCPRAVGSEDVLILDHDHAWLDDVERVEDPPVDPVEIDRQHVDLTGHRVLGKDSVDVLPADPGIHTLRWMSRTVAPVGLHRPRDPVLVSVEHQRTEVMVDDQIRGVAGGDACSADVDAAARLESDQAEDVQQHTVLAVGAEHVEPDVLDAG